MQITQTYPGIRTAVHYTAKHRHHLPGGGYTDWSEGILNGRHSHGVADSESQVVIGESVGSPVHRHAWNAHRRRGVAHGYTSGPLLDREPVPPMRWLVRVLGRVS